MAEPLGDRLVTTTVGFGDRSHNELKAAGITAAHVGGRHYAELVEPHLDEVIGPVTERLGEPLADSSAIPTWYVSRAARAHVTVALSGDGGDESFAGYDFRHVPHAIGAGARRWMPRGLSPSAGWLGANWPRSRRRPRALRAGTILENLSRDPAGAYYSDLTSLKPPDARRLMGLSPDRDPTASPIYQSVTEPYSRCPSPDAVQRAEHADLKVYPNDPLVKVDRMSMAHGLEVRCPLLDRRMVELAFRVPASRKQVRARGRPCCASSPGGACLVSCGSCRSAASRRPSVPGSAASKLTSSGRRSDRRQHWCRERSTAVSRRSSSIAIGARRAITAMLYRALGSWSDGCAPAG